MAKKKQTEETTESVAKKKKPREKTVKVAYPGLKCGPDGNPTVKLDAWPVDYDPKVHMRLRKKDFLSPAPFLEQRADRLEKKVKELRLEAEAIRKGGVKESKEIKRMNKLAETFSSKIEELRKELGDEGVAEYIKLFEAALSGKKGDEKAKE